MLLYNGNFDRMWTLPFVHPVAWFGKVRGEGGAPVWELHARIATNGVRYMQ